MGSKKQKAKPVNVEK